MDTKTPIKALRCCARIDSLHDPCEECPFDYTSKECNELSWSAAEALEAAEAEKAPFAPSNLANVDRKLVANLLRYMARSVTSKAGLIERLLGWYDDEQCARVLSTAAAIVEDTPARTEWISPKDRLPPDGDIVPVVASGQFKGCICEDVETYAFYFYDENEWYLWNGDGRVTVTWWMDLSDLPNPPRKDDSMSTHTNDPAPQDAETKAAIISRLGICELLCQLAEECGELVQAALKLRRVLDGRNPTPKTYDECVENFYEEYADVDSAFRMVQIILDREDCSNDAINETQLRKVRRWLGRLEGKGE